MMIVTFPADPDQARRKAGQGRAGGASRQGLRPSGLSEAEFFAVVAAARALAGYWLVQRDEDERGQVSVALVGSEAADAAPVFVIERLLGVLRVAHGRWSRFHDLGPCPDIDEALALVRRQLEPKP